METMRGDHFPFSYCIIIARLLIARRIISLSPLFLKILFQYHWIRYNNAMYYTVYGSNRKCEWGENKTSHTSNARRFRSKIRIYINSPWRENTFGSSRGLFSTYDPRRTVHSLKNNRLMMRQTRKSILSLLLIPLLFIFPLPRLRWMWLMIFFF